MCGVDRKLMTSINRNYVLFTRIFKFDTLERVRGQILHAIKTNTSIMCGIAHKIYYLQKYKLLFFATFLLLSLDLWSRVESKVKYLKLIKA